MASPRMMLMSALLQQACDLFAARVQTLMQTFLEITRACNGRAPPQLDKLRSLLEEGTELIKEYTGRGFLGRLLKGKR